MVRAIPLGNCQIINYCEVIQIFRELFYITTTTFSITKRKILFEFQLRITLKALAEINLASGHTKEDKIRKIDNTNKKIIC